MSSMKVRAFEVNMLPVTNTKPTRIQIRDIHMGYLYDVKVILNYDHNEEYWIQAENYLFEKGILIDCHFYDERKGNMILITNNLTRSIK